MSNALDAVKTTQEVVRDRLMGQVAGLIPDEVFQQMIDGAVTHMLTPPPKDYAGDKPKVSPLQQMIRDEMRDQMAGRIKTFFADEKWQTAFDHQAEVGISPAVDELIEKHAATLMQTFVKQMMSGIIEQAVMAVRHNTQGY